MNNNLGSINNMSSLNNLSNLNNNTVLSNTSCNSNIGDSSNINISNTNTKLSNKEKNYENKINNYFSKQNSNSNSKPDKTPQNLMNTFNSITPMTELQEEIRLLKLELENSKKTNTEKDIEIDQMRYKLKEQEHDYKKALSEVEFANEAKDRATESLINCLRELEEMKRAKQKEWVNNQSFRIGKLRTISHGLGHTQVWEDGVEVKQAKQELEEIAKEKEEEKN